VGYRRPDVDEVLVSRVRRAFRSGEARRMREEAGLSIRELASLAKLPQASLQRWEAGGSSPRAEACVAWAKAMEQLGLKV
jgi:transcriptional regulator with XRE-family HTH domain